MKTFFGGLAFTLADFSFIDDKDSLLLILGEL
jgi:hypothetical protein